MNRGHGKSCTCERCWIGRELRLFEESERRTARRKRWQPPLGSIWTGARHTAFGIVLRDPSERGRYRVQLFDARGFLGHRTRSTLGEIAEVLHVEFGERLRAAPKNTLDRLAASWGRL